MAQPQHDPAAGPPPEQSSAQPHRRGWHGAVASRLPPRVGRVVDTVAEQAPLFGKRASIHRMTLIALLGAVCIIWLVPQVAALFRWPGGVAEWVVLVLSASLALSFHVVGWLCVLPISDIRGIDEALVGNPDGRAARWHHKLEPLGKALDAALDYFADKPKRALVLLIAVFTAASLWSQLTPLMVHAALLCVWIVAQRYRGEILRVVWAPEASRHAASKLIGRGILVLLITNTVLELLWGLQGWLPESWRYRVYSTWAILQTLFAIALVLRAIDVLGLLALPLIRVWPLAVLLIVLALTPGGEQIGTRRSASMLATPVSAQGPSESNAWFEQLIARIEEVPSDQPALLVAASGGGSRTAITAALVYEQLARTPISKGRTLADNVVLISSVSGGSLATAYFLTQPRPISTGAHSGDGPFEPRADRFVREMANDFMAPLLRGVLNLLQERGSSVASFWRERYRWSTVTDSSTRVPQRPLAVFNATHVQTGSRVGFGIPALPEKALAPAFVGRDLDPDLEIDLADAVRMSANFPYGFEHVVLAANQHGIQPEIIDGGLVDNTGLDTLALLLENIQAATTAHVDEAAPTDDLARERRALGQRVRAALLRRGLLLIEIDAGARPSEPNGLAARFPTLSKPLEALGRAGHQNSGALRMQYLQRLRNAFPDNGKAAVVGLVRAGFDCNSSGDVMTAWALDYEAREQIFEEYARTEDRLRRTLDLQQHAIRLLQKPLAASATPLEADEATIMRAIYDDYLDRMLETDAEQHASAPGCKPPHDAKVPGRAETALSQALAKAHDRVRLAAASNPTSAPSAPSAGAAGSHGAPAASAPTHPTTDQQAPSAALGWVYVGQRNGSQWQTRYLTWKPTGRPLQEGDTAQLVTSSNVRANPPDAEGRLAPARMVLPARAELKVLETQSWGGTDFVWARVAVPEDRKAQEATIAKAAGPAAEAPAK